MIAISKRNETHEGNLLCGVFAKYNLALKQNYKIERKIVQNIVTSNIYP